LRIKTAILFLFLSLLFIPASDGVNVTELQKQENVLVFAGDESLAPYSFYKDDIPTGFCVDLVKALSTTVYSFSSKNIQIRLMPWEECVVSVKNGGADGLIGAPVYKKRLPFLSYTQAVAEIEFAIFVNSDNTYINSLESLEGTIVAVHRNCPVLAELEKNEKIQVLLTDSIQEALMKLKNREVTAVISERNSTLYYIQTENIRGLNYVGSPVGPLYDYSLAVDKTDLKLLRDLNLGIETLMENGTLAKLQKKWFGLQVFEPFPWKKAIVISGSVLAAITLVLIILWVIFLNATIKAKTRQIQIMSEKMMAKDKLAVLGKLAAQIAHELRTPLSIIHNSVFLLHKEGSENRELFEKRLHLLEEKVKLTSNILESILSYSRVKAEIAKSVSAKDCIEEALKDIELPEGIKIVTDFRNEELLYVFMDFHQMYSVFRNIILNAIQAMEDEGTLTIKMLPSPDGKRIITSICDTGKGIAEGARNKIFNLFYSSKITGTGLGLPISKSIVEANEGKLYLEETSAKGTCFIIDLPVYKAGRNERKKG